MKAKAWFTPLSDGEPPESVARKAVRLADCAGLADILKKNGFTAILQHVGEGDGIGFIKPQVTGALAEQIEKLGARPFFTGSATLYRGPRSNARDHILQAYSHGFTPDVIKCPIVMCDGLRGADRISTSVPNARHCKTAYLGSTVAMMDALVAVTHPTGHPEAGYGAALKNVAMGLSSRGGKLAMHHGGHPNFLADRCTSCGQCARWCPVDAIVMKEKAELIVGKCIGCGQCYTVCSFDAIKFDWAINDVPLQERIVEYCIAVNSELDGKTLFVNVIQHFQKGCDCFRSRQKKLCPDVGIVVSRDCVAADTATADLLERTTGKDIILEVGNRDYRGMLAYAEEMGLGSREYDLIERIF